MPLLARQSAPFHAQDHLERRESRKCLSEKFFSHQRKIDNQLLLLIIF